MKKFLFPLFVAASLLLVACGGKAAAPIGHAVEVLPFGDWPHMNGRNTTEMVTAPSNGFVLVQYGFEARVDKKEVPGCGLALVPPGTTVNLTIWDGNAEILRGSAEAVKAYAESELAARRAGEKRCAVWAVTGLLGESPVEPAANASSTSPCGATYTVQPGDGRLAIAAKCQRTWSEIAVENDLPDDYRLYPEAVLKIP